MQNNIEARVSSLSALVRRREERGERRRQTLYLLFLAMLTVLTADCQAWTWDAWQHDTPLFEAAQLYLFLLGY